MSSNRNVHRTFSVQRQRVSRMDYDRMIAVFSLLIGIGQLAIELLK
ncbi:hypothetical protein GCM10007856_40940 [Azospirillum oryzae]|nr:hypothetical protein GCM10007856_40940 [Azospirillum oryzae]